MAAIDIRREYTWTEWIEVVKAQRPNLPRHVAENVNFANGGDPDQWLGDGSVDDAIRYAEGEGWRAPIVDSERLVAHIETDLGMSMVNDFVTTYDVAGSEVDMGRFMAGEPECMIESLPMKVMRTGRVIKIAVPVCYPSTMRAETVKARGAAVMALVNAFAMMQHPVEIYAGISFEGDKHGSKKDRLSYSIKVQDADQPLNMGRVMYALAHPTMLRYLGFAAEHQEKEEAVSSFSIGGSYGHPSYAMQIEDLNINVENAIILPPLMSNYGWSEEESVVWIKQQLTMIQKGSR